MSRGKAVAALMLSMLALAGCASDDGQKDDAIPPSQVNEFWVDMQDGRRIPCVSLGKWKQGIGISCDWSRT